MLNLKFEDDLISFNQIFMIRKVGGWDFLMGLEILFFYLVKWFSHFSKFNWMGLGHMQLGLHYLCKPMILTKWASIQSIF